MTVLFLLIPLSLWPLSLYESPTNSAITPVEVNLAHWSIISAVRGLKSHNIS